jgi:hypothetical protein
MEEAFGTIVWVVAVVGAIVAVYTLVGTGRSYREIGGGGLVRDRDDPGGGEAAGTTGTASERDEEIRQMLEARNVRRERRGEAPLDVEAEIAALPGRRAAPSMPACARRSAGTWLPATRGGYATARNRSMSKGRSNGGSAT